MPHGWLGSVFTASAICESDHGTCLNLRLYSSKIYMCAHHARTFVCATHVNLVPSEAKRKHWIWNVTDGWELPCCNWESILCPLGEQLVLLTTEWFLQLYWCPIFKCVCVHMHMPQNNLGHGSLHLTYSRQRLLLFSAGYARLVGTQSCGGFLVLALRLTVGTLGLPMCAKGLERWLSR